MYAATEYVTTASEAVTFVRLEASISAEAATPDWLAVNPVAVPLVSTAVIKYASPIPVVPVNDPVVVNGDILWHTVSVAALTSDTGSGSTVTTTVVAVATQSSPIPPLSTPLGPNV